MSYEVRYIIDGITVTILNHQGHLEEATETVQQPHSIGNAYYFHHPLSDKPFIVKPGSIMTIKATPCKQGE